MERQAHRSTSPHTLTDTYDKLEEDGAATRPTLRGPLSDTLRTATLTLAQGMVHSGVKPLAGHTREPGISPTASACE